MFQVTDLSQRLVVACRTMHHKYQLIRNSNTFHPNGRFTLMFSCLDKHMTYVYECLHMYKCIQEENLKKKKMSSAKFSVKEKQKTALPMDLCTFGFLRWSWTRSPDLLLQQAEICGWVYKSQLVLTETVYTQIFRSIIVHRIIE